MQEKIPVKPLAERLGMKPGQMVYLYHCPLSFRALLSYPEPKFIETPVLDGKLDFILCFSTSQSELRKVFSQLAGHLKPKGMLWIAWPKMAAKLPTDLNDNIIRGIGVSAGLVDTKVVKIDEVWSGLKFVSRLSYPNPE